MLLNLCKVVEYAYNCFLVRSVDAFDTRSQIVVRHLAGSTVSHRQPNSSMALTTDNEHKEFSHIISVCACVPLFYSALNRCCYFL